MGNKVVIFCAPSGAGKSTVVGHLLELHPEFEFSVSAASRKPRGNERDGIDYHFMTAERFRELIAQDAFVEHEEVYPDHFYGTLKCEVDRIWSKGNVIIFDVDVKGGVNLKRYFGDSALSVVIVPPGLDVLERRLRGRGTDSEEDIRMRLDKAAYELEFARGRFDYVLVNDDLQAAFREIEAVVDSFLAK